MASFDKYLNFSGDAQQNISFVFFCSGSGSHQLHLEICSSCGRQRCSQLLSNYHCIPIIILLDNFPQLRSHTLLNCFFHRRCFLFQIILQDFLGTFSNSNINFLTQVDVNCIFFQLQASHGSIQHYSNIANCTLYYSY